MFGVDAAVDDAVPQAHLLQVNRDDAQHAGPLGHDDAAGDESGQMVCLMYCLLKEVKVRKVSVMMRTSATIICRVFTASKAY